MGKDRNPDGVTTYPADQHDLDSYRHASRALSELQVPVFVHASNPHERLFVAAFDGTGNSMHKDAPDNHTNVALIYQQIQAGRKQGITNISAGYVEGPGTQDGLIARNKDLITGGTFEPRVEEMYEQFIKQAKKWLDEDPSAKISLAITGFSRGAEQAAALARLVHERGIQDPLGALYKRADNNLITHVKFNKPPLVSPGQTAQAVGLFDPVGTGEPRKHNRALPPSVISGFQITAEDERRDQFKSTNIIDPGFSEQRHFLNVTVGGAHSNIGGCYLLNGLAIRAGNSMADYLNGLSDRPFIDKRSEPTDPKVNVVHRSEEHQFVYTTRNFERNQQRSRLEEVDNPVLCQRGVKRDCWNKDAYDPALDRKFEHRAVPITPSPVAPSAMHVPSRDFRDSHLRYETQPQAHVSEVPAHLQDFRHEGHPRHIPYQRFMQGFQNAQAGYLQESNLSHYSPEQQERLAAGLTEAMGTQPWFNEIAQFVEKDGVLWARELQPNMLEKPEWVRIDLAQTLTQTPAQSAAQWREREIPAQTPVQAQTQTLDPKQLSATDLRHPDHPRHDLFTQVRGQLSNEYDRWGLLRDPAQLDRETAQCVVQARDQRMGQVGGIQLSFPSGMERPTVTLLENPANEFGNRTSLKADQLAQAPQVDQTSVQLQQVEQHLALATRQEQQFRQEREMGPSQGRSM